MDHEYKNPQKIVGLIVLLVLVGCMRSVTTSFGDAPDLKNWVSEVRARPAPPLEQLPVMQQFETFEYSAQECVIPLATLGLILRGQWVTSRSAST